MAFSHSNLPSQKLFSVVLVIYTTFSLLLATKVSSQKTVSFNFTKFTAGESSGIILQGNSEISNGILALTTRQPSWNTGRALYTKPVPIWDSATGNVASFVTSFSFIVEDIRGFQPADGLIFFLAPQDTQIPNDSAGGRLGVVDMSNAINRFVGVEFDSFVNEWDPNNAHIGIDVASLISLKTVTWNRVSGSLVQVSIIYDSSSKTLSAVVTDEEGRISTVAQVVDLKSVLPEVVRVGLSATTTEGGRQKHDIHSWSFTSILETSDNKNINLASYA